VPGEADAARVRLAGTLAASAALGFAFGLLYPATHVAIEPAQLLAGVVAYPQGNAFALYESRVWTVLHQLLALPLLAGVGERTLTQVVSGAVGALNFAALAAFARALGAPASIATFAAFLVWAMNPVGWGFGYPILIVGHPHTYGTVGLAWVVLACGLLGARRFGWGAALLAFAPALHVSVGASMAALAGLAALVGWRDLGPARARLLTGGVAGAALAGVSLAAHRIGQPPVAPADPAVVERLFPVFMQQWDAHRQPLEVVSWQAALLVLAVVIALAAQPGERDPATALVLRVVVASALAGVAFALIRRHAPADALPRLVLSAMPTRILNFPVIVYVPLVLAALARPAASWPARGAAAALAAIALLWTRAHGLLNWGLPLLGVAAAVELATGRSGRAASGRARRLEAAIAVGIAIGTAQVLFMSVRSHARRSASVLVDRSTDPALAAAAESAGLLAVAPGIERAQLVTRRPIVIDPQAIDMVTYVPDALPELARAIEGVYGLDFDFVAAPHRNRAVIPVAPVRAVWEARSAAEWSEVAAAFDVQDVLVPAGWTLQIPEVARSRRLALYRAAPARSESPGP
jgi:hypothetical protein